jgi:Mlc titration factor MtfA (ptsG expression regulator)
MDHYGATNPAEFFAVATETFFEKPYQMAEHHEELYAQLLQYYKVDPRDWMAPPVEAEHMAPLFQLRAALVAVLQPSSRRFSAG